ncbi:MAG: lytic transglycosylase domain-containing protein [Saprospiraceae bacterium]|nr:lytic transglycosylase domain-containing protein [Saprospiraceae bacterium]
MNGKYLSGLITGLLIASIISVTFVDAKVHDERAVVSSLPQIIESVDMNKGFTFGGEQMPNTFDARERLDRELSVNAYWHSSTLLNIKAAKRYFPVMEKILAENGIPEDFKFLAVAESNLRNVSSPASAKGFWQFRKLAAREFGLEVNDEVDERYHLEKATKAACKYLKQLHKRFGNWTNAAAAYNVGPTNFSRILKSQGEESFYNLNLNDETSRYVFRLIAIKEIMSQPDRFGFYLDDFEKYEPLDDYYEVTVKSSVDSWSEFAKKYGISYRMLKIYNPWLRDTKLTVIKNTYQVKIPKNS